ncbi:MAG: Clp protease N-terminal domain-containing protein [Verrucomicrobiales bacterium]
MNPNKFTIKLHEALQAAQEVAEEFGHPELKNGHVLLALLDQSEGIFRPILEKLGVSPNDAASRLRDTLNKDPKMQGGNQQLSLSGELRAAIAAGEKEMKALKDEFLSVEHFVLGVLDGSSSAAQALQSLGIDKQKVMQALQGVRGNQRVVDQDPEGKYQTLEKYGTDLTALARQGKIDPVIGRDAEIRRIMQVLSRRTKNNPVLIGEPGVSKPPDRRGARAPDRGGRRAGIAQEQARHLDGPRRHVGWRSIAANLRSGSRRSSKR